MSQKRATSVWLTDSQKEKLRQLAETLGTSPNATIGQLVDNAQIAIVTRHVATATIVGKNNRHDAKVSQASNAMTVGA
jgi:hypothetical protein